jgi:hypothetical protein
MPKPNQQQQRNNKPVQTIRLGVLSVSIWRQEGSNGTFYRVTPQRAYTEGEGEQEEWKHTTSFGRDDILTISELMRQAWVWILRAEQEAKERQ